MSATTHQDGVSRGLTSGVSQERRLVASELINLNEQHRTLYDLDYLQRLRDSIAAVGQLHDIHLIPAEGGRFDPVAGFCRILAGREAGLTQFHAVIHYGIDNGWRLALQLIENTMRKDPNPMDLARGYESLIREEGLPANKIAEKYGLDQSSISKYRQLLSLSDSTQRQIERGELTFTHAYQRLCRKSKAGTKRRKRATFRKDGLTLTMLYTAGCTVQSLREFIASLLTQLDATPPDTPIERAVK
ncbi:MAG: ParB/RepB/Spo0J family partition protein [Gemmataceae bacterium]